MPMRSNMAISRRHLDARFGKMRPTTRFSKPAGGWIRAIRQSLGMTAEQLADRMRVSQPRITALEHGEAAGAVNLKTLQRAAQALNCTLIYALVPNQSLERMVRDRALQVAAERLPAVEHTMRLEDQALPLEARKSQLREVADALVRQAPRSLWNHH